MPALLEPTVTLVCPETRGPTGAVRVWFASLAALAAQGDPRWDHISEDERVRSQRFHFARDGRAYVAGRGWARQVIGGLLGVGPAEVRFTYGRHGKPELAFPEEAGFRFNISHADDVICLAVASGREVGVDVEWISLPPEATDIAESHFSPGERRAFEACPERHRALAFARCWTRKEAVLKALGSGLATPLAQFDVSIGSTPALLRTGPGMGSTAGWTLLEVPAPQDYVAAVALYRAEESVPADTQVARIASR